MGQYSGNDATFGLSGKVGKMFSYRQRNGETVVGRKPSKSKRTKKRKATADQIAVRLRFKEGTVYAKNAMVDAALKAQYEPSAINGITIYNLAVADYFTAPVVNSINKDAYQGAIGDKITIRATDDFKVVGVKVVLTNADGSLLEQGEAMLLANGLDWQYTATQANAILAGTKIKATANDLPGNTGVLEITL